MPSSLGAPEILVILVVALIVLGPKRLPEAGRQIGKAMSEVRRWSQSVQSEIKDVIDTEPDPTPPPAPAPAPSSPTPPGPPPRSEGRSGPPPRSEGRSGPPPRSEGRSGPVIDTTSSDGPPGEAPQPGAPSAN